MSDVRWLQCFRDLILYVQHARDLWEQYQIPCKSVSDLKRLIDTPHTPFSLSSQLLLFIVNQPRRKGPGINLIIPVIMLVGGGWWKQCWEIFPFSIWRLHLLSCFLLSAHFKRTKSTTFKTLLKGEKNNITVGKKLWKMIRGNVKMYIWGLKDFSDFNLIVFIL